MNAEGGVPESAGQLREEAAVWFARMRGPEADDHRAAFERWLARGALHRAAFNRIAEVFSAGKLLKEKRADRPSRRTLSLLAGALLLGGTVGVTLLTRGDRQSPNSTATIAQAEMLSVGGQLRRIRLEDGSVVTLDSDTRFAVRLTDATRLLQLERGRARFDVRHERRPFIVTAGTTRVTAHGTLFDVALLGNRSVSVELLRGAVDVSAWTTGSAITMRPMALRPGQRVVTRSDGTLRAPMPRDNKANWASLLVAFDRTPLSAVIAQANRYSVDQIAVADPAIGTLIVSGTFRINDPDLLTERLAALFGLTVDRRTPGVIVLGRRPRK